MPIPDPRHPSPGYVELRCRSAFSFLAGASSPEDLIARAAELDHGVLALGDRDGVYGAPRFHQAAKRAGVRAIVGCEVTFGDQKAVRLLGGYAVKGSDKKNPLTASKVMANSLYFLVATLTGYRNLCRLLTQAKLRAPKGESVVTWEDLEEHAEGLICLFRPSQSPEEAVRRLGGHAVKGSDPNNPLTANSLTANSLLERLQALFPHRLYIDLQRHLDPGEERLNRVLLDLARSRGVPIVATNDVRHATPAGRPLLDVLTCLHEKTTLDQAGRRLLKNAERHLKPARQMAELFRDLPEALANTRRIAEQCEFTLADLGYRFPEFPLPAGETAIGHLRELTFAGARERYGRITPRVRRQLEHELAVIGKLDLAGYFLIVWDIVRFCRDERILMQGRGSAANSAVCYALGITAVDAVGMELLFERFLSEERGEWPDIDIDLPSGDQREKVIQYVYRRYGERGAGMTANVITYRTRSAVREVGKALGFGVEQVDRLSKLLNRFEFRDDLDELAVQLRAGGVDPEAPRVRMLVDLVARIQNLPRHLGQHSGGMVIAAGRLDEVVPLEPATMPGRVVVQWDKDDCADLGIIKVDLLGLGMMAVLEETIPLIRRHEGVEIDLAKLPPDDPKTYDMLQKADTIGVFQVESRAQMATLPRMKPDHFYDLVVEVAIIRPGPIVGQMVHPYLSRRAGREPATYAHPDLEPILKRTLGVPLFQEQLLRMAMTLAGFTGGEAEELRRAMGFKRSVERMKEIEARLRRGMSERGIAGKTQDDIVRSITSFALYGFPESHAASFALLAYASAYLRAHHLAAFTCAMLNNWPMGFYHPATLVKDAQRHGLRVLPIDVMRSGWKCRVEKAVGLLGGYAVKGSESESANSLTANTLSLRLGLRYVAGLREEAGKRIEEERAITPFRSVADFAIRTGARDDEMQALAHVGAFAELGLTRREAMWQVAAIPRGSLFRQVEDRRKAVKLLGGYAVRGSDSNPLTANSLTANSLSSDASREPILSRSAGLATSNGSDARLLPSDAGVSEGRVVRAGEPDPSRRSFSACKYRRGQRADDPEGLCPLPPDRLGQSARTRNLSALGGRSELGQPGENGSISESGRLGRKTPEPSNPITRKVKIAPPKSPNSLTANSVTASPLPEMSLLDRTLADYRGTGLTIGPHLIRHLREELNERGVTRAGDLPRQRDGKWVKIAGLVIVRQRPGSAKGFCFLTLEDETGLANAVVVPKMFEQHRTIIHTAPLLLVEGPLQIVDGVIHVRARRFERLELPEQDIRQKGRGYRMRTTPEEKPALPKSHDFR
jgi:error-prone DNA polymerase